MASKKQANPAAAASVDEINSSEEVRECRCMFCGKMLLLKSEEEAIEHMSACKWGGCLFWYQMCNILEPVVFIAHTLAPDIVPMGI